MSKLVHSITAVLGLSLLVGTPAPVTAQQGATNGEWRSYGGDLGSTKYSPLDQIDATNFSSLQLDWRWQSADGALDLDAIREEVPRVQFRMFQATPLMVDGVLYISTALHQVAAIDAATGETLWVHDPEMYLNARPTHFYNSRGVAYWEDGDDRRIFFGTHEAYLLALDAATGEPIADFGDNGRADLMASIPRADRGQTGRRGSNLMGVASPPIVARDVIVTPNIISDGAIAKEAPPGWIKGIDARTGETKWMFRTVPQADDFGADSWLNESWRYSGNTNVWSFLSVDDENGYVYLPTGTPTGDYYGGHRIGDNLFAESIVALDILTGQRMWHFQAVHHGVWDYDFPAAPNLADIRVGGVEVPALAQVSKQGFTYVFDRITGELVWPIEERPVATDSDMEGEVLSPTQPFPTQPPPFEYQGVTIDDLVDFTPEIREMAIEAVKPFRLGPLFTPISRPVEGGWQGTLMRPPDGGAATWAGAALDPETGWLYVPSRNQAVVITMYAPDPAIGATVAYTHGAPEAERLAGRGPGASRSGALMPQGLPLLKPPYSRMTAINMNTGDHEWMQPLGNGDRIRNHPRLRDLNLPPLGGDGVGGPVLTKTMVVSALSAGGSTGGPRLVARSKETGEEFGSVDLPTGALGTPMTYMVDGVQYIALPIGGRPPQMIAFRLPE